MKVRIMEGLKFKWNHKRNTRLFIYTFLSLLLISFQNCSPVGNQGSSNSIDDSSNGNINNSSGSSTNSSNTNTTNSTGNQNNGGGNTPPSSGTTPITSNPVPPNPTALTLSANTVNSITLNWSSGGGSTVGYRVVYQEGTSAPANCSSSGAMTVNTAVASIANLTKARQYSFRVCAINGNTTPDVSAGTTLTTGTRCFQNQAPSIVQSSFPSFSFPMGMGSLSGTATNIAPVTVNGSDVGGSYDQNSTYSLRCTSSPANILDLNCAGNNGVAFTNNAVNVTFQQAANSQCPSTGPVTVTLTARDECGTDSAPKTITVNVTNECVPEVKISAKEQSQNDQFGSQVAIEGNYAVAIETGDNEGGQDAGAANVYFFDGSNWVFQQKLIPTESAASDNMKSVAISGNRIVVGSPYHPTAGVGAVYVYERSGSTWNETAYLTPSEPNVQDVGDLYGYSVALMGTQLVVGAPHDNNVEVAGSKLAYAGAVYVYNLSGSNWVQDGGKITVAGNTGRNEFGASVAIGNNFVLVGAPYNETFRTNGAGKAYILTKTGTDWVATQTIESSNKKNGDMFGAAVATDGVRLLIGAPFATGKSGQTSSGAAYVFQNSGSAWSQSALVYSSDGVNSDHFGYSVAIQSDDLVVGTPWDETKTGSVYQFARSGNNWTQKFKIMARDRATQDELGGSVALSNRKLIIGSRLDDGAVENVGAAYIVDLK